MENYKYKKEFELAKKLIIQANKKILSKPFKKFNIKIDKTLVTNLDLECEKFVIENIMKQFPNDNYVSEETNSLNKLQNRSWILDPIDGTNYFIKGYTHWGVQIAFYDEGEVKFSIIFMPKANELYECIKGCGVLLNGKYLKKLNIMQPELSVVEYNGDYVTKPRIENFFKCFNCLAGHVLMQNAPWSSCYLFTNLVYGRSNVLINSAFNLWDYLPGELMVMELGVEKIMLNNNIVVYSTSPHVTKLLLTEYSK